MENPINVKLEPFANIHDARYMIYWLALTNNEYQSYIDSLSTLEKEKIRIEKLTLDFVASGEQQPETGHAMKQEKSKAGNANQEFFREADSGGYFSSEMKTNAETDLSLIVRYWGAEWGGRKFNIYIDEQKLLTVDNSRRWNQSKFKEIKDSMLQGKSSITIILYIHTLKPSQKGCFLCVYSVFHPNSGIFYPINKERRHKSPQNYP